MSATKPPTQPSMQDLIQMARSLVAHAGTDYANLIGVSAKTVYRHGHTGIMMAPEQYARIIRAVHPKDRELAKQIADRVNLSLVDLGLEAPPPPPVPPAPPAPPPPEHAELVLYAAAEALNLSPSAVRPAIAAAFARAQSLGASVEGLVPLLSPPPSTPAVRSKE